MRIAEIVLVVLAIVSLISDLFYFKGGDVLFLFFMLLLALLYLFFSFALLNGIRFRQVFKKQAYQQTNSKRIFAAVCLGISFFLMVINIVFIFMYWKGGRIMLLGNMAIIGIPLILAIIKFGNTKDAFYLRILKRGVALFAIIFILNLLPRHFWLKLRYRNSPEYIGALEKSEADPNDFPLMVRADSLRHKADDERFGK